MVKSLREQKREAARLGIIVRTVPRTGEVRFIGPDGGPSVTVNHRRKDGTREVERMLEAHTPEESPRPRKEKPPVITSPSKLTPDQAAKVIAGRTAESVLREIVAEGKADPRVVALVRRFDARAERRAAKGNAAT